MQVEVKKLFHGYVSVRDYLVEQAKNRGEDLVIIHGPKKMTVPYKKLLDSKALIKSVHQSKFNPSQSYTLIDFKWEPDEIVQGKLF